MTIYNNIRPMCAGCKYATDNNVVNPSFVYCKQHKIEVRKNKPTGVCAHFAKKGSSKYNNEKTYVDNILFDSKREGVRYSELKLLQKAGEVKWFIRQVPFDLGAGTKYRADFLIVWKDGKVTIEDVKGYSTKEFTLKKKLVEGKYPIEILIIK